MNPGKESTGMIQEISVNMKVMWLTPDAAYLLLQLQEHERQQYFPSLLSWAGLFSSYLLHLK